MASREGHATDLLRVFTAHVPRGRIREQWTVQGMASANWRARLCREEVGPLEEFNTATVRLELLPMLAYPFDRWDRQQTTADEGEERICGRSKS